MNYNKNARKLGATNIQLKVINFHLGSLEKLGICINGTNYWRLSNEHSFSKQNIFREIVRHCAQTKARST